MRTNFEELVYLGERMKKVLGFILMGMILQSCGTLPTCKNSRGQDVDCRLVHEHDMYHQGNLD